MGITTTESKRFKSAWRQRPHNAPLFDTPRKQLVERIEALEVANYMLSQRAERAERELRQAIARERFAIRKLQTTNAGQPAERQS